LRWFHTTNLTKVSARSALAAPSVGKLVGQARRNWSFVLFIPQTYKKIFSSKQNELFFKHQLFVGIAGLSLAD
jgi:hypothetical protein